MAAISSEHPVAGACVFAYVRRMEKPPIIDHDPHEPTRPSRGEHIFVTVGTAVILIGLALFLKWVDRSYGGVALLIVCATVFLTCFGSAVRSERKKGRRPW
jgi:peptidoglycan/LPS O-acetylase OafA/YrhL